jgi:hypothetical protein
VIAAVHQWEHLGFPKSLSDFQHMFPRQIKAMDRVGGANLILDWPAYLPHGAQPKGVLPR